eukprot:CAMPEP_0194295614 /NCGR_PEP_ID=MMETSP0169-20130528/53922_1 /TAXON_ID=218684 /ORGANISM="Corethron pennatum, Strain L29A3" /LENGTH=616 /DNA_ID=CAMNT_0039044831 /DNA_START=58 /DNA_END=1908 /DNA_ORIENTATION=-
MIEAAANGCLWSTIALCILGTLFIFLSVRIAKWRLEAQKRLKAIRASPRAAMERIPPEEAAVGGGRDMASEIALHPDYRARIAGETDLRVVGLGEYLATLRPKGKTDSTFGSELETAIGGALLDRLGPGLGTLLLPSLGAIPKSVLGYGEAAAAAVTAYGGVEAEAPTRLGQVGSTMPANVVKTIAGTSLLTMASVVDINSAIVGGFSNEDDDKKQASPPSSIEILVKRGEPHEETFPPESIPNPFVFSQHYRKAIDAMEKLVTANNIKNGKKPYDPDEFEVMEATPVDEKTLPGLHRGMSGVKRTQNRRGILENRLISILMNNLSSNDIRHEFTDAPGPFSVVMDAGGSPITRPEDLVAALRAAGNAATCTVVSRTTTFGLQLCVKEDDGTFSYVPIGYRFRTGMRDVRGGNIDVYLPHSSIDLEIKGPSCNVLVQYYHDVSGVAGWMSGDYPDTPWTFDGKKRGIDLFKCVRQAGFHMACCNSAAERGKVPLGGYTLYGTCNDSVAIVESAAGDGTTGVYPLGGVGGWHVDLVRRAREFRDRELTSGRSEDFVEDLEKFYRAVKNQPIDSFPTLATMDDCARRLIASSPDNPIFQSMEDGTKMCKALRTELAVL